MDPELSASLDRREDVLGRLRAALIEQLRLPYDPDQLDPDAPLFGSGLGLDSLDAVEIVVCIEREFRVDIAERGPTPARMRTLNTLVNVILDAGGEP